MTLARASALLRLPAILVNGILLASCGQTGPLHLPADEPAKERYLIAKKKEPKPAVATNVKPAEAPAADPVPPEAASPGDQPSPSPQP